MSLCFVNWPMVLPTLVNWLFDDAELRFHYDQLNDRSQFFCSSLQVWPGFRWWQRQVQGSSPASSCVSVTTESKRQRESRSLFWFWSQRNSPWPMAQLTEMHMHRTQRLKLDSWLLCNTTGNNLNIRMKKVCKDDVNSAYFRWTAFQKS